MKKNRNVIVFLALLIVFFLALDFALENSCTWASNDYEVTCLEHPEKVWDKVFFGNSAVISAYLEEESQSGYINLGIDYGVITDLRDMLEQGHVTVGSELLVGVNFFTFCDEFDTNPSYIWHRKFYEPYAYFHRDKLLKMMEAAIFSDRAEKPSPWEKILYYGNLSDQELAEKMQTYEEMYFSRSIDEFEENLSALDDIADWCTDNGVTLRLVWMPFNPSVQQPAILHELQTQVGQWANERKIEVFDMTSALDESCFHDVGHLNREHGAYIFTAKFDLWFEEESE